MNVKLDVDIHDYTLKNEVELVRGSLFNNKSLLDSPKFRTKETPLHIACANGYTEMVNLLLEHDADIKLRSGPSNWTALHYAANQGNIEIMSLLVEKSQQIEALRKEKEEEEKRLVEEKRIEEEIEEDRIRVEKGLSPKRRVKRPTETLPEDEETNDKELIPSCDLINIQDDEGFTPVHHAVVGNHINAVLWLLNENNADAGIKTNVGDNCVHLCCYYGHLELLQLLFKLHNTVTQKVNVTEKNNGGNTPLHRASIRGHSHIARFLVRKGGDLLYINKAQETPLDLASPDFIKELSIKDT
jgi:ankyrin repeat protein